MLAMAVVNNHEESSSNGHASPDSEDVLTRLRQIQRTLRECHFRLDRTDRWADSLLGKGYQEEWTPNGDSMYEGHVNGVSSECHSKLEEGGRRLAQGFVVKEGVCKESIIASEVVEELVPDWESDLETVCGTEDAKPTEVRTIEQSEKQDNHPRKYISRLPRQHSIDLGDENTEDDFFEYGLDDTYIQPNEDEIITDPQVSCNGVPYDDNGKHQDGHFIVLVKECKDQIQQTEPEAISADSGGIEHPKCAEKTLEHLRETAVSSDSGAIGHLNCADRTLEHLGETAVSSDSGAIGHLNCADRTLEHLGETAVSSDSGAIEHLKCAERTLEHLRQQFSVLKVSFNHTNKEDWKSDPENTGVWGSLDEEVPEVFDENLRKSTLPNLNPQNHERLEPEFCDGVREGNLLRIRVRNDVDNKDQIPLSNSFYQKHFRVILPILIMFSLLLMFLLLACYLLLVVPFVVVSFRHMDGTITF